MKRLILLLMFCLGAFGQQENTVFATVTTNYYASNTLDYVLPPKYMIGQAYHQVMFILGDITSNSCNGSVIDASLTGTDAPHVFIQASYDGVNYTDITNYVRDLNVGSGSPTNRFREVATSTGAFPFIEVSVEDWDNTKCQATVYYTGSIQGVDFRKYSDFTGETDILNQTPISIDGPGTETIITNSADMNMAPVVYGVLICTAVGSNNISFNDHNSITSTDSTIFDLVLATEGCITLPNTTYPYMKLSFGGELQITSTATGFVTGLVLWRGE